MMYPNHQGKYDALGIVYTHRKPCSIVMDKAKSNTILVKEFIDLLEGKRLDKKDVRQALTIINRKMLRMENVIFCSRRVGMILITAIMSVTLKPAVLKLH